MVESNYFIRFLFVNVSQFFFVWCSGKEPRKWLFFFLLLQLMLLICSFIESTCIGSGYRKCLLWRNARGLCECSPQQCKTVNPFNLCSKPIWLIVWFWMWRLHYIHITNICSFYSHLKHGPQMCLKQQKQMMSFYLIFSQKKTNRICQMWDNIYFNPHLF